MDVSCLAKVELFNWIDYTILIGYLALVVIVGSWMGKGQGTLGEYFLADRKMPWFVVCISIVATDLSAISFMGVPAWLYEKDMKYFFGILFMPLIMFLAAVIFVRVFHRIRAFTVFEYLEMRFHTSIRVLGALLFLLRSSIWVAGAIYMPSLAMSTASGLSVTTCIMMIGILATVYTVLGGMKAVIWTDFIQFIVLVGGIVMMILVLMRESNWDFLAVWQKASSMTAAGSGTPHTRFIDFSINLKTEATFWSIVFFYFVNMLGLYGTDQVFVQRYVTIPRFRDIAKSVVSSGMIQVIVVMLLTGVGILMVVHYQSNPELRMAIERSDQIVPHFIVTMLPTGLRGLLFAALLAATMSTVDSALNSISTVFTMDIVKRFGWSPVGTVAELRIARIVTLAVGILTTLGALWLLQRQTTILETVGALTAKFVGPITGVFFLGILVRRSNLFGAVVGILAGAAAGWVAEWGPIAERINWMWIAPCTTAITAITGWAASLFVTKIHNVDVSEC